MNTDILNMEGKRGYISDFAYDEEVSEKQIEHIYNIIKEIRNPEEDTIKLEENKDGI